MSWWLGLVCLSLRNDFCIWDFWVYILFLGFCYVWIFGKCAGCVMNVSQPGKLVCSQELPSGAKGEDTGMGWKKDARRSLRDPLGMDAERKGRPPQVFCYRSGNLVCGSVDQISEAAIELFFCLQPTCCPDRGGVCVASGSWWTWGLREGTCLLREVRKRSSVRSSVGEDKRQKGVAAVLVQCYGLGWEI